MNIPLLLDSLGPRAVDDTKDPTALLSLRENHVDGVSGRAVNAADLVSGLRKVWRNPFQLRNESLHNNRTLRTLRTLRIWQVVCHR